MLHGAAVDHAAPVVEDRLALARRGALVTRVLLARLLEAADALVHVPAERADHTDVVVVPHVAVGHDVEAGLDLVANDGRYGVVVGLFVRDLLERHANVTTQQLMLEPTWAGIGPDHGRREDLFYDLLWLWHLVFLLLISARLRVRGRSIRHQNEAAVAADRPVWLCPEPCHWPCSARF